jgi:hypothetical protein
MENTGEAFQENYIDNDKVSKSNIWMNILTTYLLEILLRVTYPIHALLFLLLFVNILDVFFNIYF